MLLRKVRTKKNLTILCGLLIFCTAILFHVFEFSAAFAQTEPACADWDQKVVQVNDNGTPGKATCLYGTDKTTGKIVSEDKNNPATSASSIRSDALRLIQYALGFLALVGVAMIIYGGFVWITSSGNETLVTKARKILIAAAIGLLVITVAWVIVSFVVKTATDTLG